MVDLVAVADVSGGPGWWQASDGRWYPPHLRPGPPLPPPPPPQATPPQVGESSPSEPVWTWGLLAAALVLAGLGIARLLLDVTATVFATSVSCGNAIAWLGTNEGAVSSRSAVRVCGAQLHNASVEGIAALVVGFVLLLLWLVITGASWPLVVLVAFLSFTALLIAGQPLAGFVVAAVLLVGFAIWRTYERRRVESRT